MTMKGLLKTAQGALRKMDFPKMYFWPKAVHVLLEEFVSRIVCGQGPSEGGHCHKNNLHEACIDFDWTDFMRSIFIPSHHILLSLPPTYAPPLFSLCLVLSFCQNRCHGHLVLASVGRGGREWGGVNKWNINTPVSLAPSTCPHGDAGQKAPSVVHLSPVTGTAKPGSQ